MDSITIATFVFSYLESFLLNFISVGKMWTNRDTIRNFYMHIATLRLSMYVRVHDASPNCQLVPGNTTRENAFSTLLSQPIARSLQLTQWPGI